MKLNRRDFIAGAGAILTTGAIARPVRSLLSTRDSEVPFIPSASDYIQDGLTNLLDGIENIGFGTHDSDSSSWNDLASGDTLVFNKGDNAYFTDKALHREAALGELRTHIPFPLSNTTVEVVCDVQGPQDFNYNPRIIGTRDSYRFEVDAYNGNATTYKCPRLYWRSDGTMGIKYGDFRRVPFGIWSLTLLFSEEDVIVNDSICGRMVSKTFDSDYYDPSGQTLNLGAFYRTYGAMTGDFFSVRRYNHILTTAEIAYNHRIDKMRFGI